MPPRTSTAPTRTCTDCGETKPVAEYHSKGLAWDGVMKYQSYCRPCANQRSRARAAHRPDHPQRSLEASRRYQQRNRELIRQKAAARRALDPVGAARYEADRHLKKKYGLTRAEWDAMLIEQSGRCWLCEHELFGKVCVDHCHTTSAVRRLLCDDCNKGCGSFHDRPDVLRRAADYVGDPHEWYRPGASVP